MADSRLMGVEPPTERAQAFLRLADDHLDAAYRMTSTESNEGVSMETPSIWRVVGSPLTGEPTALGGSNLDRPRTLGALLHLELNALAAGEPIEVE